MGAIRGKEKNHGNQETHQAFEEVEEARRGQAVDKTMERGRRGRWRLALAATRNTRKSSKQKEGKEARSDQAVKERPQNRSLSPS